MGTALLLALVASSAVATSPGQPAPPHALPRGLDEAPWAELYVDHCKERLTEAGLTEGYTFSRRNRLQERKRRHRPAQYCYVPQGAIWTRGPTGVKYLGFTMFNCAMALAMTRFEVIAQEEAKRIFESKYDAPIKAISHMGSYNCRTLRKKPDTQSQHSFGNALDLKAFYIRGVGLVDMKKHWTARIPAQAKKQEFLRSLVRRLREEQVFTNVLDATWDQLHDNHIHVDLAPLSDGLPSPALARAKALPFEAAVDADADATADTDAAAETDASDEEAPDTRSDHPPRREADEGDASAALTPTRAATDPRAN